MGGKGSISTSLDPNSDVEKINVVPEGAIIGYLADHTEINYLPYNGNVLIEPKKVEEKTKGGIIKTPKQIEKEKKEIHTKNQYRVVAFAQDITNIKLGDIVYLANETQVEEVEVDGEIWWSINFFSIMGKRVELNI